MSDISLVETAVDDPEARRLLTDYFAERAASFPQAGGYVVTLPDPAKFVAPVGTFIVVRVGADAVGCGGIRRLDNIDGLVTFEVKHVWVDPSARGRGLSRVLMGALEQRARELGGEQTVLDTNGSLSAAQHLYRSSGYREVAPYNDNPNATHWFAKPLSVGR